MNKLKRGAVARYAAIFHWEAQSEAYRSLSPAGRALLIELRLLYNGVNNGELFLSLRDASKRLSVAVNTAHKAFRELEDKGFIKPNVRSSFSWKKKMATTYILTSYPFREQLPTKEFMRWKPPEKNTASKIDTLSLNA